MQASHPMIGAAVRDYSRFKNDPWGRLSGTTASLMTQLFGAEQSVAEAQRLRQIHRNFTGTDFAGERYSGLNPDAYAWVQMSNADTVLLFGRLFGTVRTPAEQQQAFDEIRCAGLVLGVDDKRMPTDVTGLREYVAKMSVDRLVDNPTVRDVLDSFTLRQVPPPRKWLPGPVWAVLRPFGRTLVHDFTVGTLPTELRDKLELRWSDTDQRRLDATVLAVRAATPLIPDRLLHYPQAYRAMQAARRHQVA
jgi:uncharacterized protein (DUF2236 family)